MTTEKKAHVFVFTEWHIQQGKKPGDWPPFGQNKPPDNRTLRQLVDEIHLQRDSLLLADFSDEERMQFFPEDVGPEEIGKDSEPKWKLVWGVIVDRNAVSSAGNAAKLRKMGNGLAATMAERSGKPLLFLTPKGNGLTPRPLTRFEKSFVVFNVEDPSLFIFLAAAALAEASQQPDPEVAKYMQTRF